MISVVSIIPSSPAAITKAARSTAIPPGWQVASDQFLSSMNRSIDPCDNFYEYACGKWISTHPLDSARYFITQDEVYEAARVAINSIDDSPGSKTPQPLQSVKQLFLGCENTKNDSTSKARKIHDLLQPYGGWPILNANWSWSIDVPKKFHDFSYTIGWLSARYDLGTLMHADLWDHLRISRPWVTSLCGQHYCFSLESFILNVTTDLAKEWNITLDEKQLSKDIEDMVKLEQKISRISEGSGVQTLINISSAQERWPNINWRSYFDAVIVDLYDIEVRATPKILNRK